MDAAQMFLIRHQRMHAQVDRLTEGLGEEQIRLSVHPMINPMAWLLWHMARAEDSTINLLIRDGEEVLDDAWSDRLGVERRDVGTGMTEAEVADLSTRVDLPSLKEYRHAVGEQTVTVVSALLPSDLDGIVSAERIHRFVEHTATEASRAGLEQLWQDTSRGHFLVWLPLTHNYEHIGQADLIRAMLGRPGRF